MIGVSKTTLFETLFQGIAFTMKKIITPFLLAALLLTGAVLIAWNAKYNCYSRRKA